MEIWSEFIHEEIFVLKEKSELKKVESAILGLVVDKTSFQDEELLQGILKATKLNPQSIIRGEHVDGSAKTWLVFKESLEFNNKLYFPLNKLNGNNETIILAYPLSRLRSSQNEKAELWGLLKVYFDL